MRLRQIALVARDLAETETRLENVLGLATGYHDPGIIRFGLDNWVAAVGDTFLEVVSPVQEDTTAGRYLERRGGDGGYMVILQVADLDTARERLEAAGARIVHDASGRDAAGATTDGLHVHPRDCGGAILSLDVSDPVDAWVWAGDGWQDKQTEFLDQIVGVELQSATPEVMATRWTELLGVPNHSGETPDGRPCWTIDFDADAEPIGNRSVSRGVVRFVEGTDGRGDGVCAFDVRVRDADALAARAEDAGIELEPCKRGSFTDQSGVRVFFR